MARLPALLNNPSLEEEKGVNTEMPKTLKSLLITATGLV